MKREIKFRGKCSKQSKYAGEWVYGNLVVPEEIQGDEVMIVKALSDDASCTYHVDVNSVGQFTDLTDKNGKDIYEGDILRVKEYKNEAIPIFKYDDIKQFSMDDVRGETTKEWIGEVKFEESVFFINDTYLSAFHGDMRLSFPMYEIEVIGNIYDNKELLED